MNVTTFSGAVTQLTSHRQPSTPHFGSKLDKVREAVQQETVEAKLKEPEAKFKTIGDTVLFTHEKGEQEKVITVADVLADLYEKGAQSTETINKDLPGFDEEKLVESLGNLVTGDCLFLDKPVYGLSEKGEALLKKAYPNLNLPKKGHVYKTVGSLMLWRSGL